jgi:hypothetical protein
VWQRFSSNDSVVSAAKYINGAFRTWFPQLHQMYEEYHRALLQNDPTLSPPSPYLLFAAMVANFGPETVCNMHRDMLNLAYGLCVVIALGQFDYNVRGHLVLHEAKLIIPFRPGDIILFPSAAIVHQNIPIQTGKTRSSMTWFSSGSLFRWVDQEFQSSSSLRESNHPAWQELQAGGINRWNDGCSKFQTLEQLSHYWAAQGVQQGQT